MKEGEVRAVISTMNIIDKDGDLTLPGAFGEQRVIISAYGHGSWQGDLPVGKGRIHEEGEEAIMEGAFFLDTVNGRETYQTVKDVGELQEWSYALPKIDYEMQTIDGERVRVLKHIEVPEVSPVLLGAGIGTRTLDIKQSTSPRKRFSGPLWVDGKQICSGEIEDPKRLLEAIYAKWFKSDPGLQAELEFQVKRFGRICKEAEEWQYIHYMETERVDPEIRQAALYTLEYCKQRLPVLWPVTLIWVRQEGEREREYVKKWGFHDWETHRQKNALRGWTKCHSDKIYIRADLSLWDTCGVVAHELAHTMQPGSMSEAQKERQAEQIAYQIVNELSAASRR